MSKAAPAIPLFGDAYIADTRHLSLEEHGAYLQLLMIAWRTEDCALPNDDKRIAQMLSITAGRWSKIKPAVMAFWTLKDGRWTQKRLTKERRFVAEKSKHNSDAANARWKAKSLENNDGADANALPDGCQNDAPPPPPTSVDKSTGGEAADPVKDLFDLGVALLEAAGTPAKQARSLIGKWRKEKSDGEVLAALLDCRRLTISEPVEWIEKRFKGAKYVSAGGYEYRGNLDAVIREAEKRADWGTYWQAKGDRDGRLTA